MARTVRIEDHVQTLLESLPSDDREADPETAHSAVADLAHKCLQDISKRDVDLTCSVLFSEDRGVLIFLRRAIPLDEFKLAKKELLQLLHSFINKGQTRILTYAVDIKDTCLAVFSRDRQADVKNATFPLLIKVLQLCRGSQTQAKLDVPKLIDRYFNELTQSSRLTSTVKQGVYHLLGVIAESYPELMVAYADKLISIYVNELKNQMKSKTKKPEYPVITGCLRGLTCYLNTFSQSADEGSGYARDVYDCVMRCTGQQLSEIRRYDVAKSALWLLAKHAAQLDRFLLADYKAVYSCLRSWSRHHNRDVQIAGYAALEAVLKQIASVLVEGGEETRQRDTIVFTFFVREFRTIIEAGTDTRDVAIAVRGYGSFAAPCKLFLSEADVQYMFTDMVVRSRQIFHSGEEMIDSRMVELPPLLEALASIVTELDQVSESFLASLEQLVVLLFGNVPLLRRESRLDHRACGAVVRVLLALRSKRATQRSLVKRVVFQGLLSTCSHPVAMETSSVFSQNADDVDDDFQERDPRNITYIDYMDMWRHLLGSDKMKGLNELGVSMSDRKALTCCVYDEIVTSLMKIVGKLDLSTSKSTDPSQVHDGSGGASSESPDAYSGGSDFADGLVPCRPKDFLVFFNLVEFTKDLLSTNQTALFRRWIYTYGHEVILLSTRWPVVSGLYKLLTVCLSICSSLQYFKAMRKVNDSQLHSEAMETDSPDAVDNAEILNCFTLFKKFSKEVLVKLKMFRGDLLVACLQLVMALPYEIVVDIVPEIVPAVQVALKIGLSYPPMAHTTLDALEMWVANLPADVMQPYYKQILPHLDGYLKTTEGADSVPTPTVAITSANATRGRKKIPVKLLQGSGRKMAEDSALTTARMRIVRFLGGLGGANNISLISCDAEDIAKVAVAWDAEKNLKFGVPFADMKPVIYFDVFLPRVTDLALSSSDRQTKVVACELLHALLLYILGTGAQQPDSIKSKRPMSALYSRLFPVLLRLGCDVEPVAKQLFEPLVMQTIHWFTLNRMFESPETMCLLDAIMTLPLRDFCGSCIREFLIWSIRQTTVRQQERSPGNTKSLLKRMYSLALHPSAAKRRGATLVFNNIYTVLREEEMLVDTFIIEILVTFVDSLALAHNDEKSLGTQEQCAQALDHIERILRGKAHLLNKDKKSRRRPKEFTDATLFTTVGWLLQQCGRPQTECRHKCMELVCKLSMHQSKLPVKSAAEFFRLLLDLHRAEYFIERFEAGGIPGGATCLSNQQEGFEAPVSMTTALSWFDHMLAILDCYTWVFSAKLLQPTALFAGGTGKRGTNVFAMVSDFMRHLVRRDISGVGGGGDGLTGDMFTPGEMEKYNRSKCMVVIRAMDLFSILLNMASLQVIPDSTWSMELWDVVLLSVLDPTRVGFNMADIEVVEKLPEQTERLLIALSWKLPNAPKKELHSRVARSLSEKKYNILPRLPCLMTDTGDDTRYLSSLVCGYEQLYKAELLLPALQEAAPALPASLLTSVFEGCTLSPRDGVSSLTGMSPSVRELGGRMLRLAFTMKVESDSLLSLLFDDTRLLGVSAKQTTKGSMFYSTFGHEINNHLVGMATVLIPKVLDRINNRESVVMTILTDLLDQVGKDRETRKRYGSGVVNTVLQCWGHLRDLWVATSTPDRKDMLLMLLRKLLLIDSSVATKGSHSAHRDVYDTYCCLLVDAGTSLAFKTRVMELLHFYCELPEQETTKLRENLDRMVADFFPLRSSDFIVGSPKYHDYVAAMSQLLDVMEVSGSTMLLRLVISIVCRESKHAMHDQLQTSLSRFIHRLSADKQKLAADSGYSVLAEEGNFPGEIRRSCLDNVVLPLLRQCCHHAVVEFFRCHLVEIIGIIEAKVVKLPERQYESQLISKICSLKLLELMYACLPKEDVYGKDAALGQVFLASRPAGSKELTPVITRLCYDACREDMRGERALLELRRQYHCTAYNVCVASVSRTKTEPVYYSSLLLQENPAKGQLLWDNIIDCHRRYGFDRELSAPLQRKRQFVAIRTAVREIDRDADGQGAPLPSVHYLASQYLADSSLSEDLSRYDFNVSTQARERGDPRAERKPEGEAEEQEEEAAMDVNEEESGSATLAGDYVEMEMDELNQHECMASMVALINHLATTVCPIQAAFSPARMPAWMELLHGKFSHVETPLNVRVFIARLVVLCAHAFRPCAASWLAPLMHLVVNGNCGVAAAIHSLTADVVVVMLSWTPVARPQDNMTERSLASRLLEFLMRNARHATMSVFRNNLEIIKTLVECWRDRVDVPSQVIYENMCAGDITTRDNSVGVQLLGVVVANNLPPYSHTTAVDSEKFFQAIVRCLANKYKEVYAAAAEVLGMILHRMVEREDEEAEGALRDAVVTVMLTLHADAKQNFIVCLQKMTLHYPAIADRLMSKLLFMLPSLQGSFRSQCLEVILTRVTHTQNLFLELKSKGFLGMITHRDEATQLASLHITNALLSSLSPGELLFLLPAVTSIGTHPRAPCRQLMYDILMWVYDSYRDSEGEEEDKLASLARDSLLQGLNDSDDSLRMIVTNFWSHATRLPTQTLPRLLAIAQTLYSPATEPHFLSYATYLLLQLTSLSPDYKELVFTQPLSDCKFQDYNIATSWQSRHAALTPLFTETQASQAPSMQQTVAAAMQTGEIRATQVVPEFTATQDVAGGRSTYNWLTQSSSIDTFADQSFSSASSISSSSSSSSLLFTVGRSPRKRQLKPSRPGFGERRLGGERGATGEEPREEASAAGGGDDVMRLRRRFLKDQEQTRVFFARREARRKKRREEAETLSRQRREGQVTMYRKYRIGELPDVQIQFCHLISPLQALAQRDARVAQLLFSSLCDGVVSRAGDTATEREVEATMEKLSEAVSVMASSSTSYFSPFIGCLLDVCYSNISILRLDPAVVTTVSQTSMQQNLGIVLLEKMLMHGACDDESRPAKRMRAGSGMGVSQHTDTWIELARLYKSLGDYDTLHGIFNDKIGTQTCTQEALQAEASCDYKLARKLYQRALEMEWGESEGPGQGERDLWDISLMQCLDRLTDWTALDAHTKECLIPEGSSEADLQLLWEDTYYEENHLPFVMRARLKRLLVEGARDQTLLSFVDAATGHPDRRAVIETWHGEELALLYIVQGDYTRARHHAARCLQAFLRDWASLDALMLASRAARLRSLQKLTEMNEFLDAITATPDAFTRNDTARALVDRWMDHMPHPTLDPVSIWDDTVINRCLYMDHLSRHFHGDQPAGSDPFLEQKFNLFLAYQQSAMQQRNPQVALKHLRTTNQLLKKLDSDSLAVQWTHSYVRTWQQIATGHQRDSADRLHRLLDTIKELDKHAGKAVLHQQRGLARENLLLKGRSIEAVAREVLTRPASLHTLPAATREKLSLVAGAREHDHTALVSGLISAGFRELREAVDVGDEEESSASLASSPSAAHVAMASYCDYFLRVREDDGTTVLPTDGYAETVITSLLRAMALGSSEARDSFPRLLQLVDLYPDTLPLLTSKVESVPCWMFIGWISQMVALLDKREARAVQGILLSIAESYPQALIYPLNLSREHYTFTVDAAGAEAEAYLHRLLATLSTCMDMSQLQQLVASLEQLSSPHMLFSDFVADARPLLMTRRADFPARFRKIYASLFDTTRRSQEEPGGRGRYWSVFARTWAREVEEKCGRDGSKLLAMAAADANQVLSALVKEMKTKAADSPGNLKEYSTWLTDFHSSPATCQIEIPGQYRGRSKPMPEYHVKIAGFDEKVLVMKSLRLPKRITIRGHDENEYMFLVKGGEDLRQDQRLEQLFDIMNRSLDADAACRQRALRLRTYAVVPMSTRLGLLEWVPRTKPLKQLLQEAMTQQQYDAYHSYMSPAAHFNKWAATALTAAESKRAANHVKLYARTFVQCSKSDTVRSFRERESMVPPDLLRQAFLRLSASPEAFLALRTHFIKSHATLSVCHYVVGVGDRHLSNFMVSQEDGGMVGIDFGHAFGTATQCLPIPELMPVRLTRQFLQLLLPHEGQRRGLLYQTMVHTLRALRDNHRLLLNTLDVFIKEPSIDWKATAERLADKDIHSNESDQGEQVQEWYPKQTIGVARSKLIGANPAHITKAELALGHRKHEALKQMTNVVLGDPRSDLRAQLPPEGLTVEQQVQCIIEQATEPSLLGRTWVGWEPWM